MNIFTIPISNIRRKLTKTMLLILVFSLGVMSIAALLQVSLVVGDSLERKLSAYGANIIVAPKAETLRVSYGGFHMGDMLYNVEDLDEKGTISAIKSIELKERISVVAPKLVGTLDVGSMSLAAVGVRWDDELGIKSYWAIDGQIPQQPNEVLLGHRAAQKLLLKPEDLLPVGDSLYKVAGVLEETGGDDDQVIFLGLSELQTLLRKPGSISFVEVAALCAGCPIDDIVTQIRTQLPGTDIKALQNIVNQRMASIHFVQKLAFSISLVILLTAAAMIGLSMLAAVNERKKDIGILRSLGYGKSHIFIIFCVEAAIIGLISGLVGYSTGYAASFKALDILALSDNFQPIFSMVQLLGAALLFGSVTVLASLYPAWKGATIDPSEALTSLS